VIPQSLPSTVSVHIVNNTPECIANAVAITNSFAPATSTVISTDMIEINAVITTKTTVSIGISENGGVNTSTVDVSATLGMFVKYLY
jgi:hypothetical protein